MVLLDTNILVYAADRDSTYHSIAFPIRESAISGQLQACISLQNLVEFYAVVTSNKRVQNPLPPEVALDEIKKYLTSDKILKIQFNEQALEILDQLARKYKIIAQNVFDLKIVATMLMNGVQEIVTANDSDFVQFSEIKVQNPFKKS